MDMTPVSFNKKHQVKVSDITRIVPEEHPQPVGIKN